NSIMSVVPSDADSVLGSAGGRNVDTSSSSLQSDFSQGGVAKADTEEIDPIAEADVYMAYGRDAQAEEILRHALAKDSSRQAFGASTQPPREPAAPLNIDFDIGATTSGGSAPLPDLDLGVGSAPSESAAGLDFDLGLGADKSAAAGSAAAASAIPSSEPLSIDFDLPVGEKLGESATSYAAPAPAAPTSDLGAIDFDLGAPSGGGEEKTEVPNASSVD